MCSVNVFPSEIRALIVQQKLPNSFCSPPAFALPPVNTPIVLPPKDTQKRKRIEYSEPMKEFMEQSTTMNLGGADISLLAKAQPPSTQPSLSANQVSFVGTNVGGIWIYVP